MRYQLLLAYDGTHYAGWQVQKTGLAIQPQVQKGLETILRHEIALTGSGRTDAGVHARGQSAHFDTPQPIDPSRLRHSLNALLPPDIRALQISPVPDTFHARYSARGKIYHYHLHLSSVISPFIRLYCYHPPYRVDLQKIARALPHLLGTHDFTAFANESHTGTAAHDPIRTLFRVEMKEEPGGVRFEFEGDGFLYKMVRNLVGTLLEVGTGKKGPEEIPLLFETKERSQAGPAVPAKGLFLMKVIYDEGTWTSSSDSK